MNDDFIKKLMSLKAAEFLKSKNIPIHVAAKAILGNDPKVLAEKLTACEQISKIFKGSFETPNDTAGEIVFARTDKNKPVGFNIDDFLQGVIIGAPKSGKSILIFMIALQAMSRGIKVWLFAKGNDAEKLIRFRNDILVDDFNGQIKKNLLPAPARYSEDYWNANHADIFIQANTLYDGTKNFMIGEQHDLDLEFKKCGAIQSLFELYDFLKARKFPNYSRDARYCESALNRLGGMLKGTLRHDFDCSKGVEELVDCNVIFNYKGLTSEASVYFINAIIARLAAYKESNGADNVHLIILDDSQLVFDANRLDRRPDQGIGYINHILLETRKYQIKFLAVTHLPSLTSKGILGSSNFKCLTHIQNAQEIDFMLNVMGVVIKDQREYAHNLDKEKREMLIKLPTSSNPFLAYIPHIPLAEKLDLITVPADEKFENNKRILSRFPETKPRVSYQDIVRLNFEAAKSNHNFQTQSSKENPKLPKNEIDSKIYDFLMAVNLNQNKATSTEIYKFANLSAGTGSRIAKSCEKKGLIKIIKVSFGRGRPRFPVLLPDAYKILGIKEKKFYGKGAGYEHVLYQHLIKNHFSDLEPTIELNRGGKFLDVGIMVDEQLISIEVAMTSVHEKVNIEKGILVAWAAIVVVACKDKKVLTQVEKIVSDMPKNLSNKVKVCLIGDLLKVKSSELTKWLPKKDDISSLLTF